MILKIKTSADVPSSEITPESVYYNRRAFMKAGAAGLAGVAAAAAFGGIDTPLFAQAIRSIHDETSISRLFE